MEHWRWKGTFLQDQLQPMLLSLVWLRGHSLLLCYLGNRICGSIVGELEVHCVLEVSNTDFDELVPVVLSDQLDCERVIGAP